MHNLIDYTRNWGKSWIKWSLAVDQNKGPHNGGCGTCITRPTVRRRSLPSWGPVPNGGPVSIRAVLVRIEERPDPWSTR
ncbi:hypothetical protein ABZS86_02275 [Streptomyces sp. NPDC005355]|uniref:hypothetical protein n=1 Tax=Streptomyces sp. NPDC005355 TaxID=3157038 RepID=UPI0033A512C7